MFMPLQSCLPYKCDVDVGGRGGTSVVVRLYAVSNGKHSAPGQAGGYTSMSALALH